MKKILLSCALLFISCNSLAIENDNGEICNTVSMIAEAAMKARQSGVKLSVILNATNGDKLSTQIAIAAYKEQMYLSEDMKKQSITEFSNKVMLACIEQK